MLRNIIDRMLLFCCRHISIFYLKPAAQHISWTLASHSLSLEDISCHRQGNDQRQNSQLVMFEFRIVTLCLEVNYVIIFFFLSEWSFPVGNLSRLLPVQGSGFGSEVISLHLLLAFVEAETSSHPAPHHAGWWRPSAGRPEAVSLEASIPPCGRRQPRGARSPLIPPQALLQQRNRKFWTQERDLKIQAPEYGKNSRSFSQGPAHFCWWYVF